ncbi:WD repeat-containing protein 74 [Cololabis saira]|uniref:WD repeat-containing protein 74 n=1 Tax=Cololabis saira TaxID=129043 RepID=UPI002AD376A7|nr:WD repeat-containing protein 74 [Cololabis saira]
MGDRSRLCSVWLGSETGILKGVSLSRKQAFNFCNPAELSRAGEVRQLCWADPAQSELLLGCVDGTVRTFSLEKGAFTGARRCGDPGEGCFSGLELLEGPGGEPGGPGGPPAGPGGEPGLSPGGTLLTCGENGLLRVWRGETETPQAEIRVGTNVCRMRSSPVQTSLVATGGKENGLKVWDLQKPETPVFSAKNLRDDFLDLRRPYWVRDLAFLPGSDKLVTCTGHHQVHVFDPATPQRRPVLEAEFGEFPLTALALPAGGGTVVVGNTRGDLALLDLRKGLVRGALKGLAGGVRALSCHASRPLVASCGLDRFLRVHSLQTREVLHKVYLKSRLNCVLMASRDHPEGEEQAEVTVKEEDEQDEVWDTMETVGDAKRKTTTTTPEEEGGEETERKSKKKRKKDA